ncbi:MAG TPA: SDR family NAD(P)-dependent oxidoreductase [Candidatus Limnocylindrales bacterium]|nr:SDR family NAD(P)-dependent oxidoreductase [Candidatus Limnocylindrales bacterium]
MNSVAGKTALVTGAGRGIGRAIAVALAKAGCTVVVTARSLAELLAVEQEIVAANGNARVVQADLTRDDELHSLVQACGAVDFLINNAGWGKRAPVVRSRVDDWDQTFRLNLRAPMILAKELLPPMIRKGDGAVINIGSVSGKSGEANGAAYSASKFGLIGFTQSLFEEVRENGIKVAVILPGFVDTPMIPPVKQLDRSRMIQADDVAEAVLYVLTSPATACPIEITLRPQRTPYR